MDNSIKYLTDDNKCPRCGSKKIVVRTQYPLIVIKNLRTEKEIFTDFRGKRIYKPSNRLLAELYKSAQIDSQCWNYECKKCGWISDTYTP